MAVRKDEVQLFVEINGKQAGGSLGNLKKLARDLKRALDKATDPAQVVKLEGELKKVNDQLQASRARTKGVAKGMDSLRVAGLKVPAVFNKINLALNATGILAVISGIVFAFQKLREFGSESVELFDIQAKADAQLKATLAATGEAAGRSFEQLKEQASELQEQSLFGDQAIQGAQSILLTFKGIRGEVFDKTLPTILDLSTAFDQDLKGSAIQLGKALEDPVKGVAALADIGVTFSDKQKGLIQSLVDTNKVAEAQTLILEVLEGQVKGSAKAAAEAGIGPFQQLQNTFGDVKEEIGLLINTGIELVTPALLFALQGVQLFTRGLLSIPAFVSGVRAAIGETLDVIKDQFTVFSASGQLFAKNLKLAFTIDGDTRRRLKQEIVDLQDVKTDAENSGRSIGEAFRKAFDEAKNKQQDFSSFAKEDVPSPSPSLSPSPSAAVGDDNKSQEELFKNELADLQEQFDKKNLLIEQQRLKEEISKGEAYALSIIAEKEFYEQQLELRKEFGLEEESEYLKTQNKILELSQVTREQLNTERIDDAVDSESDIAKKVLKISKATTDKIVDNEKKTAEAKEMIQAASVAALGDFLAVGIQFLQLDEDARKKNAVAIKAFETGRILVNLYAQISSIQKKYAGLIGVGPVLTAIESTAATFVAFSGISKIASQKFANSGRAGFGDFYNTYIPAFAGGGNVNVISGMRVSQTPNIPTQPNGDNILSFIRKGEVVLNERHQRLAGGPDFFRRLGVPGFAEGGLVTDVNTTPQVADLDFGQPSASLDTNELISEIKGLRKDVQTMKTNLKAQVVLGELQEAQAELEEIEATAQIA